MSKQQDIDNAEFAALYIAGVWDDLCSTKTGQHNKTSRLEEYRKHCSADFLARFDEIMGESGLLFVLEPKASKRFHDEYRKQLAEECRKDGSRLVSYFPDDDDDSDEAFFRGVEEENEACINME